VIAAAVRWWHYACAWAFAASEFFTDPAIDLNTDFSPEFDIAPRDLQVFVFRRGNLIFDAVFRNCDRPAEEIELLFIDAGFPPSSIDVREAA